MVSVTVHTGDKPLLAAVHELTLKPRAWATWGPFGCPFVTWKVRRPEKLFLHVETLLHNRGLLEPLCLSEK